ncbi:si:dkey-9p24.5 isoform X2 [Onychostoma macrolepis]|uniref:si:dkey-9p24.5 isoform X2 n=1 Tax=Onychostoma macrolepis TaxID=369639 RepID=UPI00272C1D98|nr:si:dkey-9p24.5 isoform X2 [Onychostoma macrolepis]
MGNYLCGNRPERVVARRDKRMIGGENVKVRFWPWQVSVQYQPNSSAPFTQVCGGAIVHRYWIMTAASCVNEQQQSQFLIRAGSSRLDVDAKSTQKSEVARIIKHKRFNPVSLRYNIALLEMATPFKFNEFVHPICVPDEDTADHRYESCHITGYNAQPGDDIGVLQEAEVELMSRSLCNKPEYWNYTVAADMLCVGDFGGGVDGCENENRRTLLWPREEIKCAEKLCVSPSGLTARAQALLYGRGKSEVAPEVGHRSQCDWRRCGFTCFKGQKCVLKEEHHPPGCPEKVGWLEPGDRCWSNRPQSH